VADVMELNGLTAVSPCADLLPLRRGALELSEAPEAQLTLVQLFKTADSFGQDVLRLPNPGTEIALAGGVLRWFGKDSYLLIGAAAPEGLGVQAAVSDQSDAWARMILDGPEGEAVLARLVPVDLRAGRFEAGHTCRTLLAHVSASITRLGPERFEIMVFRSMAATAVHDLAQAMEAVAAQSSQ